MAACRAALIATLLPDPGTPEKRKELLEKIGGDGKKDVTDCRASFSADLVRGV